MGKPPAWTYKRWQNMTPEEKKQSPWSQKRWIDLTPEEKEQAPWFTKPQWAMSAEERRRYHDEGFRKRKPTFNHDGDRKRQWIWNEMTEEWILYITQDSPCFVVLPQLNSCSGNPYIARV